MSPWSTTWGASRAMSLVFLKEKPNFKQLTDPPSLTTDIQHGTHPITSAAQLVPPKPHIHSLTQVRNPRHQQRGNPKHRRSGVTGLGGSYRFS